MSALDIGVGVHVSLGRASQEGLVSRGVDLVLKVGMGDQFIYIYMRQMSHTPSYAKQQCENNVD